MRTLLLVGLIATTVWADAPVSVGGMIYHEHSTYAGDVIYDELDSTTIVTLLRENGTYSTVYFEQSWHPLGSVEPSRTTILRTDAGTYEYSKTDTNSATLTLTSTAGDRLPVKRLGFESENGGILAGSPWAGEPLGSFWLSVRAHAPVLNVSARGTASASKPLILGFYVSGTPRLVLIRGVGPALAQFDVPDAAQDTTVEIVPAQPASGDVIALGPWNDDWEINTNPIVSVSSDAVPPAATVGAFTGAFALPSGSKDAAVVVELPPGAYTAIIRAKSESLAEVLGEVYIVP